MAPTAKSFLPHTRSGRTLSVALGLLGTAALVQLLVLAGYLIGGGASSHRSAVAASDSSLYGPVRSAANPVLSPVPAGSPVLPLPTPAPAANAAPTGAAPARPTPAVAVRPTGASTDLLEQARQLRARGDMNSALARLREAQVAEPENAPIIAEMALTYEAMQMPERAFEQWQRLSRLGEGIGALYNLAQVKLQNVPTPPGSTPGTPEGNTFPMQGGEVLKLTDIHKEDLPDPAAEQKVSLRIVVKNRPGTAIDPTKVRILTYFYDLVDGQDEVLTDAQTAFAWLTPKPVNWANDKSEVLETTYIRAKAASAPAPASTPEPTAPPKKSRRGKGAAAADASATTTAAATPTPKPAQVRTYLGYSVRLYYDRQLQDVQADPVRLLQKFPPPLTLSAD